jgi:hypothetical protein
MRVGRFIVRISRWMARSLHGLAARIERWSGAASTPPPVAPPLHDPALHVLAERFPNAPEHWLRMVASRIGIGGASTVHATRPALQSRPSAPRMAPRFPEGQPGRHRNSLDLPAPPSGNPRDTGVAGQRPNATASAPTGQASPPVSASSPASRNPNRFAYGQRGSRPAPVFIERASPERPEPSSATEAGTRNDGHQMVRFPDPSVQRTQADPIAASGPSPFPAYSNEPARQRHGDSNCRFAPLGGEWRSGYEARQPGELTNIWPELPPFEPAIPDAQPLLPDEDAIRLEQMVARWSA